MEAWLRAPVGGGAGKGGSWRRLSFGVWFGPSAQRKLKSGRISGSRDSILGLGLGQKFNQRRSRHEKKLLQN